MRLPPGWLLISSLQERGTVVKLCQNPGIREHFRCAGPSRRVVSSMPAGRRSAPSEHFYIIFVQAIDIRTFSGNNRDVAAVLGPIPAFAGERSRTMSVLCFRCSTVLFLAAFLAALSAPPRGGTARRCGE